ncbi:NACHT, LRR and PYD domains-containing protein 6 [Ahaetulla prasina]|uniref:NACHT, LRR and PYD domains-containing protein 6 n=1 Tax=Ahaetulla prasina TaxID=499056 RepID=UPI002648C389|nr:NACHT, LRR and PYD domains-containing protein 6 [Ahaetulla prasina]XP_058012088.1 NACHT, LRR and PYD domains-containing protein 6 [Ahaetulla prasina]XP_058012099.1 NACHT, LRR and PYD domains-containing protein 6 [Ahaetulla prasina]XP_058012108.1 NACHT, LRR and PYD domains-containing protein 6 [Ahaetulla prasina]XP_058012118.1 NACHT, LRR and PYD domains-containing protein 6 [Ahaetulla prasina]XP_058012128.1 NACHT, LRR and PYD domains-containing protein 6 [Ahaetulla prasina]XP_058012139.1 NA
MSSILEECLYNALNELIGKQFKQFKWKLNYINYNGRPNIGRAPLDRADEQDVVDLLIQHYGEDALEVCIEVLRKCNRNDLAKNLEETGEKVADVDAHQLADPSDYRNYIKKKFETMKDPNAVPGEYVPLNKRYSKLIILDYHPSEEEREDEILATGRKHAEIISERAESSTNIETLFNPDKYGLIPQDVVLQGAAGIGKTITAKKIMFDWASQQLYQDKFNYAFYICCRKMNLHAESEIHSIAEIISDEWLKCHESKNVIRNILKNEEKLLFIIDGFDEFRYSFDQSENYFCIDPWKKEPVRILLKSLFQKKLLPKSSLIITTRPTALEKLHQYLEHARNFEILGFSTKEREEYFYNFFENKDQATQAFRFVKQNDTLFTMCVIPLVSWIICTVMKQEMERGKDLQKTPCTLTAIYIRYFSSLLKFHHKESKQDVQSNVKGLCSLAAEGVWKQKILFMEEEVKKHSLNQGNSLPLFLNQSIFRRDIDCIQTYSFIHLSFQEFFAALFYVLEEGDEQHSKNKNKNFQILLEKHRSLRPDFAVGFHFLFGFLNEEKRMRELKKEFGWEISPKSKEFLLDCVKNNIKKRRHHFEKEIFSYLYETQDDNFVNNALCGITEIDYKCNSDMELIILAYCVRHCQNLNHLFVKGSGFLYHVETELFLPENKEWSLDERYMEDFFKALTKLRNLKYLCLEGWSFTESCSRHLAEVFRKNQSLKELRLSLEDTEDRAAELLYDGLQHPDCKIETLEFTGESMTEFCSRHLADILRKNQRLRVLNFWILYPDDKVVEMVCKGLQHQDCKVENLGLAGEFLTESCRHFAEVLRKNQRLRHLQLSFIKLNDDTELLYALCGHIKNVLEMLHLIGKNLIKSPIEILRKNERFRDIELSLKNTFDKTLELMYECLKYPEYTIEMLQYFREFLTKSYSRHLEETPGKNQKLRELGLSLKNQDGKALELLFDLVKDPECNKEMIQLAGQFLAESGSRQIAEILRRKQRLTELGSSLNNTINKTGELMLEGLKECAEETQQILGYFLSEFCSNVLKVLRKDKGLREYKSSLRNTNGQTMELLCEGLKDPGCTIETLYIVGEILNESFSKHLADVLRKNQRLRVLYLSLKNPDDKAIELLCEGLKDPGCTIETLWIVGEILTESCRRHLAEVLRKKTEIESVIQVPQEPR